jgi:hypothetical protein
MRLRSIAKSALIRLGLYPHYRRRALRRARRRYAMALVERKVVEIDRWLDASRETANFTYDLSDASLKYLSAFLSVLTGAPRADAERHAAELIGDAELASHLARLTAEAPPDVRDVSDGVARYGRRVGWYALVRLLRPRLVVETGTDKGLGACVLAAALRRNAAEGHPGRYVGTDIDPKAGWLLRAPYAALGEIRYGDSIESLRKLEGEIDLFINDSDHSADYERREYETIAPILSPRAVVLGDNAHVTTELCDFAARTGRRFLYWPEWPKDHWYPGGGIGAAFPAAPP